LALVKDKSMNVSLTTEMEEWVQRKVGSGLNTSASEVVREAIRALHERETRKSARLANLRDAVAVGIQSADLGDLDDWDHSMQEQIKQLGRSRRGLKF
jgi:antitoxin ParD1/3/4